MTFTRRLRYLAEFAFACLARALIRLLPLRLSLWLAARAGNIAWTLMPERRRITTDNIFQSGIAATPAEAARIGRASFRHFATFVVESLVNEVRIRADNWREYVDVSEASAVLDLARDPGRGFVLTTAHFGNWEVAGQVVAFHKPIVAISRRMNNPYTDRLVQSRKGVSHNFELLPKLEASGSRMSEVIKAGKILTMVIDQHARHRGMPVPFFGRPASTHTAAALMHLRSGTPLVVLGCARTGVLRYKIFAAEIVRPPGPRNEAAIEAILREINRHLETWIRAYPDQYLWAHRRWRPTETHRARNAASEAA